MPELSRGSAGRPARAGRRRRALLVPAVFAVLGSLVLGACGAGEPTAKPSSSSPSPSPSPTVEDDGLDDLFADADADGIPDRIQKAMGENAGTDVCASKVCNAQAKSQHAAMARIVRGTSTMIILDSSGSMVGKTKDGQTRMAAAKKAIRNYVDSSPESTERLGMMVYGQAGSNQRKDRRESCGKIETLQSIGDLSRSNVGGALNRFEPTGWTPLAASLRAAAKQFEAERNRVNRIIVVTDGVEECGGNPQAEARKLRRSGFNVKIDVVGLGVPKNSSTGGQLNGVADVSGGKFIVVNDSAGMESYFDQLLAQWVATAKLGDCVAKNFVDYSGCQALRWQKARKKLDAEVGKLRDQGKDVPADQLQERIDEAGEYYLTTLATRGLDAAQGFTPDSAEVRRIERHLEETADGRAALTVANTPCRGR